MSLYNELRPTTLAEVVGQANVVAQVKAILETGNVPNVSLFIGPRGTGKTTIARIFAKALNCEHPTTDGPCNSCASCASMNQDNNLDFIEMDGASNNKVEDVHGIIKGAMYAPQGKYKIYLIDEVHMLSISAFNALLKLLEEPPAYCRFILCTTEEQKVPATILSRCRRFNFQKLEQETIVSYLTSVCSSKNIPFSEDALRIIAKASEGCMRDALSIIEPFILSGNVDVDGVSDTLGVTSSQAVFDVINALVTGNGSEAINIIKAQKNMGRSTQSTVRQIIDALVDTISCLMSDQTQVIGTENYKENVSLLKGMMTTSRATELLEVFSDLYASLSRGCDDTLLFARLIALGGSQSTLSQAMERITALEEKCEALENALFEGVVPEQKVQVVGVDIATSEQNPPALQMAADAIPQDFSPVEGVEVPFDEMVATSFDGDELPGDINGVSTNEGDEVVGTISLDSILTDDADESNSASDSGDDASDDVPPVTETTQASEPGAKSESSEIDDLFAAWANL